MSDMPAAGEKNVVSVAHLLSVIPCQGAGDCGEQHPKLILPDVMERKLETARERPKTRLELIAESAPELE